MDVFSPDLSATRLSFNQTRTDRTKAPSYCFPETSGNAKKGGQADGRIERGYIVLLYQVMLVESYAAFSGFFCLGMHMLLAKPRRV